MSKRSEKGGQSIKSLIGVFVFIIFVAVSALFNNPVVPLSHLVAFGQSTGGGSGSGGGGGGGGGGSAPSTASAGTGGTAHATINSFSIVEVGKSHVSFAWSVTNANSIKLYAGGSTFKEVASFTNETSYKLNDLKEQTSYSFYLEAKSSVGNVTKTGTLTVKTGTPLTAPQTVVATPTPVTDRVSLIASIREQLKNLIAQVLALLQKQIQSGKKVSSDVQKQVAQVSTVVAVRKCIVPIKSLKPSDENEDVKDLQACLVEWGHLSSSQIVGYYGRVTTAAVAKVQNFLVTTNAGPKAKLLGDLIKYLGKTGNWTKETWEAEQEWLEKNKKSQY